MFKRIVILITILLTLCHSIQIHAQSTETGKFVAGIDFTQLNSQESVPDLVLVSWYGSDSAKRVYSALENNEFSAILWPAVFREAWRPAAKINLVANNLKLSPEQHLELFTLIQAENSTLNTPKDYIAIFNQFIEDSQQVEDAVYDSDMPKRLVFIQNMIKQFSISTVPTIIFKGQYTIDATQAKTPARLIEILKYLDNTKP
ncbi:hypothetical protein [Pleionea sediminis]|uniref:hypothetical protein n=1 Tax=Pleionea sediminis TaxID=2569479 RepID=UPI001185A15D|nr:hypothetical protein [Pleionea sediminis]